MAGENVVRIVVKSDDDTRPGFDSSKAGAEGAAEGIGVYDEALNKAAATSEDFAAAQANLAEAAARVTELEKSGAATADELAAAQAQLTEASLTSARARKALGDAEADLAVKTKAASDEQVASGVKAEESGGLMAGAGTKIKMAALGAAVGLGLAVKGAANFQQQTTKLVTSAGESAKNLGMVQQGILSLSSATNTSTEELASGMYMVESAGFHGAQGLTVLKAAAQGAQAEGADLGEVANAVTSGLNAYGLGASHATQFTNEMVAAVGQGKMTMQDLASSMSNVLPIAASAHISFAQVGGAVATMTSQGMSARQATQDLANVIRNMLHPSGAAAQEMRALGLNANDLNKNIGKVGLTGTMQTLTEAILRNSHGGNVLLGYMKEMSPEAQGLARQILAGSISTKQLQTAVKGLNPEQAKLIGLFENSATSATGLKQTYAGAMAAMTGGATGLNVALMLGGTHAKTFERNVKAVGDAARGTGSNVRGWGDIQKEANFQLGSAEKAVKAMGDSLGLVLLPGLVKALRPLTSFLAMVSKNKAASMALAGVVGAVLAGALGGKLAHAAKDAKDGLSLIVSGAGKLGGAFSSAGSMASSAMSTVSSAVSSGASSAGSALASAGSSVASFVGGMKTKLAEAAVVTGTWLAEQLSAAAAFIASNIAEAASATAAFVVENLATLGIVAGIALLIGAIVFLATHWKTVWKDIQKVALDAWHFLDNDLIHPIEDGIHDLVDWVKSHLKLLGTILLTVLLGPVGFLVAYVITHWDQIRRETSRLVSDVVGFFERLPGDIGHALANLASMLYGLGKNAILGLWHGAESIFTGLLHTAENWGHDIANAIGGAFGIHFSEPSEATKMIAAGRNIPRGLAAGMLGGTGVLRSAAARIAGAAMPALGPGGGGYGGGGLAPILIEARVPRTALILGEDFWTQFQNGVRAKGGDPRIVQMKVVFQ